MPNIKKTVTVRKKNSSTRKSYVQRKYGFRSGLEDSISNQIKSKGLRVDYETLKISYTIPESAHIYTPDFILPNGIIIESKGRFLLEDRKKHLLVREQHPELDIRFVFTSSSCKLNKGSKTTYGEWCEKNGFLYANKQIPLSWFHEQKTKKK